MSSIYLTPTFSCEYRFCMFIINDYYTKSQRLQPLDSLLKDVIIYCCVLFDQTGNIVDGTVQRRHLNQYIKFIFTQRMLKDQFYSLFYCDRRKFNLICFFIFLFMVTGRGIIFICSAGILTTYHKWQIILQNLFFFQKIEVLLVLFLVAQNIYLLVQILTFSIFGGIFIFQNTI